MLASAYTAKDVESEIYAFWEQHRLFEPEAQGNLDPNTPHFSIVIPPPNVTGNLHMGHALDNTIQDILIRWHRMRHHRTLWMPGLDHAGIATQSVVERNLKQHGKTRQQLGRDAFVQEVWDWANLCKTNINNQFRRLGISPDWNRQRFTLDEGCSQAVREAFCHLYSKGLIYQGEYIVNWCPVTQSAISDIETEYSEEESFLWQIAYPVVGTEDQLVVATTRPETMFGDVAVAVHPEDDRYQHLIGKTVQLPLTSREIPIIADAYVDREFGTGALKITPAHDPNDFKIGMTHHLEPVIVLDEKGALKPLAFIPTTLHGLDRFEARQQTEAMLSEQGFLVDKIPHVHRVGRAQRSGAIIEPLLSKQWFVKTGPLAEACLKALEAGDIRFIPERWTKDYLRWMTNIQDWCISRQLWWGHQIPAWHCGACHQITVATTDPSQCQHCQSTEIHQDPDVLDTWFSSGLWPFSTMGWPNTEASDYKTFYPTSVLVTGFDIIFFWVARMTMFGHELTGRSPFHTVYIHGLIRDEKGQKMSKSKGNTVDPVVAIDEYGADGFRYGLTSLISYGGQDIKLAKDKLEQGKLFANKLWNASRFVLMNLVNSETGEPLPTAPALDPQQLSRMDQWILSRYHATAQEANRHLGEYRFGELAQTLLEFTWHSFCDWYVEYAKKQLRDEATAAHTRRLLLEVLDGLLRLLHPIMPFITEAIWQQLPLDGHIKSSSSASLSLMPYPTGDIQFIDETLSTQVDFVLATVRAIRNVRQFYSVPHPAAVTVWIESKDPNERQALVQGEAILAHFIKMDSLHILESMEKTLHQVGTNIVGQSKILIPLEGLIDVDQELKRLQKKLEDLRKEQEQLYRMMDNEDFMAKAPAAVVEKNKTRLAEVNQQLQTIDEQLKSLT